MEKASSGPQPPASLERVGRYRIIRPLSKGGMALVYEARRESLAGVSPRVAIKLILPEYTESDTFQELFINEARLGASMHHQNLVQIQDFDRDGDRFFLVMEYVEGFTLRRAISLCRKHQVSAAIGVIAEVGRQACDGLHYAHTAHDEQGHHLRLVHRDVKPSNLILSPHGIVKLLDFGISKGRLMREKKGAVKGTWGYMAPEQAAGSEVGPAADVFGLATVLYEMASLRVLFEGKDKAAIKRLLLDDHAARMAATLDPERYGPLVPVLVRALQRDPAARFESAAEFGRHLSALLPDPITARDEVVAFYKGLQSLHEGGGASLPPRPESIAPAADRVSPRSDLSASQGSLVPSSATTTGATVWVLGLGAAVGFFAVLVVGFALVLAGVGPLGEEERERERLADVVKHEPEEEAPVLAADEPAGPAGVGAPGEERPPPLASRLAEEPRPPPAATVPLPEAPVAEPAPEPSQKIVVVRRQEGQPEAAASDAPALLTIGARQPAEVYVDGEYVRRVPLLRGELPAGPHVVTIQALDGRKKTFEVELAPGEELRRVWDFDRGEWRR